MTEVYIDGVRLDFEDSEGSSTLGDLVGAIEDEIKGIRRYVDGVCVDGQGLTDWRGAQGLEEPLSGFSTVNLQTVCFDDVAASGIDTLKEYSSFIKRSIESCAGSLRKGDPAGAEFASIVEGVIEVVKTIEMLSRGGGAYGVALFREDPAPCCDALLTNLEALKQAGTGMDSVLMADILEYELSPALDTVEQSTILPGA